MYGKQANDTELVNWAAEIKIRAERKCGELLGVDIQHGGDRKSGSRSHDVTLNDIGLSRMQSSRYQQIAKVSGGGPIVACLITTPNLFRSPTGI